LIDSDRRPETRVAFEPGIKAYIMGIDGTWRRSCTMADISETGASLTIDETLADLNLKEFFLVLSSNGLVYRRCELGWINGSDVGAKFAAHKQGAKKRPVATSAPVTPKENPPG
jgi:hypothetical protein